MAKPHSYGKFGNATAEKLRAQGFLPLPRLWIKADAMPEIHAIAERYLEEVRVVRDQVRRELEIEKLWSEREKAN